MRQFRVSGLYYWPYYWLLVTPGGPPLLLADLQVREKCYLLFRALT
jgi:hypothetical protein